MVIARMGEMLITSNNYNTQRPSAFPHETNILLASDSLVTHGCLGENRFAMRGDPVESIQKAARYEVVIEPAHSPHQEILFKTAFLLFEGYLVLEEYLQLRF